jgi:hypothetical protein
MEHPVVKWFSHHVILNGSAAMEGDLRRANRTILLMQTCFGKHTRHFQQMGYISMVFNE